LKIEKSRGDSRTRGQRQQNPNSRPRFANTDRRSTRQNMLRLTARRLSMMALATSTDLKVTTAGTGA
jgi:hypothetical protein